MGAIPESYSSLVRKDLCHVCCCDKQRHCNMLHRTDAITIGLQISPHYEHDTAQGGHPSLINILAPGLFNAVAKCHNHHPIDSISYAGGCLYSKHKNKIVTYIYSIFINMSLLKIIVPFSPWPPSSPSSFHLSFIHSSY